ncbi:hypothetical protein BH23PLA1_BH23PLA1_29960 [soil metagenome]
MRTPWTILAAGLVLLAALLNPAVAVAEDDGFRPLFNGKDFSGWIEPEDKDLFSVENGEIVGRTTSKDQLKKNEFLVTEEKFGDFVLKSQIKLINGNSGIQIRSNRAEDGAVAGPQADVADGYWGLLYEERERGILDRYPAEKVAELVKEDDWNEYLITFKGDHLVIELNGTKVIDRKDPEFRAEGIIGLQLHVGPPMEVRFKDIMIKSLD